MHHVKLQGLPTAHGNTSSTYIFFSKYICTVFVKNINMNYTMHYMVCHRELWYLPEEHIFIQP